MQCCIFLSSKACTPLSLGQTEVHFSPKFSKILCNELHPYHQNPTPTPTQSCTYIVKTQPPTPTQHQHNLIKKSHFLGPKKIRIWAIFWTTLKRKTLFFPFLALKMTVKSVTVDAFFTLWMLLQGTYQPSETLIDGAWVHLKWVFKSQPYNTSSHSFLGARG